jgi:hypothetical protein
MVKSEFCLFEIIIIIGAEQCTSSIFTFAYTIFRCVLLTSVLYTYRQNTTVAIAIAT